MPAEENLEVGLEVAVRNLKWGSVCRHVERTQAVAERIRMLVQQDKD
jgi:hypothetical protein